MIFVEELGPDREAALIVLADARRLAPCLDNLDGADRETAVAILTRAAKRSSEMASLLKSKTAGDWSMTRFSPSEVGSAFLPDDRVTLQALCGIRPSVGAGPVGCFPPVTPPFRP